MPKGKSYPKSSKSNPATVPAKSKGYGPVSPKSGGSGKMKKGKGY